MGTLAGETVLANVEKEDNYEVKVLLQRLSLNIRYLFWYSDFISFFLHSGVIIPRSALQM